MLISKLSSNLTLRNIVTVEGILYPQRPFWMKGFLLAPTTGNIPSGHVSCIFISI